MILNAKRAVIGSAILAFLTLNACNCGGGGAGSPCEGNDECQSGECVGGACTAPDGGGGNNNGNPDGGDGGPGNNGPDGGPDGGPDAGTPCRGLECQQVTCPGGGTTTLTGAVYTPKGDLPLYNAIVYVPNGEVQPFPDGGVTCDRCGPVSGSPIASALTGPDGRFTLNNVPVGQNIPLVIQIGKWRRQVTIPAVEACTTAELTAESQLTRLPRNKSEGDMPKMAIATGDADPFECLLLKVGIDSSEITRPNENGRVHYYRAGGGINLQGGAPDAGTLWSNLNNLKQYDVVMLPCEGTQRNHFTKDQTLRTRIRDYTSSGGRLFTTHYSYSWIRNAPWAAVATWDTSAQDPVNPYENRFDAGVDTSFPKGQAFADWLVNVEASETHGWIGLHEVRHNVDSVIDSVAQRWLHGWNARENSTIVPHFTFNTPINPPPQPNGDPGEQCGRVVFSSFHVSQAATDTSLGTTFPTICKNEPPTAQEKALIFMFFDLASCVQDDDEEPEIPTCAAVGQGCGGSINCCENLVCVDMSGNACEGGNCYCDIIIGKPDYSQE